MKTIKFNSNRLTENFSLDEFCQGHASGCLQISFDERFLQFVYCLQEFRTWYGRPININSGYRTPWFNKSVGGSSNSSHLYGLAVDFNYPIEYRSMSTSRKKEFLENVRLKWARLSRKYGYAAQTNYYDDRFHLGWSLDDKYSFIDYREEKF